MLVDAGSRERSSLIKRVCRPGIFAQPPHSTTLFSNDVRAPASVLNMLQSNTASAMPRQRLLRQTSGNCAKARLGLTKLSPSRCLHAVAHLSLRCMSAAK